MTADIPTLIESLEKMRRTAVTQGAACVDWHRFFEIVREHQDRATADAARLKKMEAALVEVRVKARLMVLMDSDDAGWWQRLDDEIDDALSAAEPELRPVDKITLPPAGYRPLPAWIRCKCIKSWTDGAGNYFCCQPRAALSHQDKTEQEAASAAVSGDSASRTVAFVAPPSSP